MSIFSNLEFNSLDDLFLNQLEDLYDAEKRLTKALPKMADAASSPTLKQAFQTHLQETEGQVQRLESIFRELGHEPERETCQAMKGLIAEGEEMISATGEAHIKDAALIAAAQRVEHYEISGYGTARTLANRIGRADAASKLEETLHEEAAADKKLTQIAESETNMPTRAQAGRQTRFDSKTSVSA